MAKTFRIIPKRPPDPMVSCSQYGLIIADHPLGTITGYDGPLSRDRAYYETGMFYRRGDYIATWNTREEACAAAFALGMSEVDIQVIGTFIPETVS